MVAAKPASSKLALRARPAFARRGDTERRELHRDASEARRFAFIKRREREASPAARDERVTRLRKRIAPKRTERAEAREVKTIG